MTARSGMRSPLADVVAIVGGLNAVGGAVAGAVAALIGASVLTPTEPVTAAQIAVMALEYGLVAGVAGAVLGTAVAFGALRRVPLGRIALATNLGFAAGLTTGWLGGPWAWHHMGLLGAAGFCAGALVARLVSRDASAPHSSATIVPLVTSGASALGQSGASPGTGVAGRTDYAAVERGDAADARTSRPGRAET
jgi:hypothetical protein